MSKQSQLDEAHTLNIKQLYSDSLERTLIQSYENAATVLYANIRDNIAYNPQTNKITYKMGISEAQCFKSIFPIIYLYRHAIELSFKELTKALSGSPKKNHSISNIWEQIQNTYLKTKVISLNDHIEPIDSALSILKELEIEQNEQLFRYTELKFKKSGSTVVTQLVDVFKPLELSDLFDYFEKLIGCINSLDQLILQCYEIDFQNNIKNLQSAK